MKILVVTSVFPNSKQPTLGVFVKERMFKVAKHCEVKVVAPVPWFPFIRYVKKEYRPLVPYREIQDGIEVLHPRFFNFPGIFKCFDGIFFFFSSLVTVLKVKRCFNFDVIDAHFAYPDGIGAVLLGKLFKKPVSVTVRGTIEKLSKYALRRSQITYALKRVDKVFTVCRALKGVVVGLGIPEDKVTVISNGVDLEKFKKIDMTAARMELKLPLDKKIIISVGGLVERKGFHRVISVLPEIKMIIPNIFYIIVGGTSVEGDWEPTLRKMVRDLGLESNVLLSGMRPHDELFKWLSASDVFCLATSNEGWANVFLEAMACGLPIVTTRVGGNEEVISSEDYGVLFDLGDEKQMIEAIKSAIVRNWDSDKIISYARANTWDRRVEQLLEEFRELTGITDITGNQKGINNKDHYASETQKTPNAL